MDQPVTLVTGTSRGIGRAVADHLIDLGHHVIGLSRSAPDASFKGEHISVDLADETACAAVLDDIVRRHQVLRVVNNAGIARFSLLAEADQTDLAEMMNVNVRASLQVMQACLPAMRAAGFGRIVNISSRSMLGKIGRGGYAMSKAAVGNLTRSAALELAPEGITVNCVAPGPVETEMFQASLPQGSPGRTAFVSHIPVGRMGSPREIATATAYFLSPDAGYTTGQILYVCGGMTAGRVPI